ncbi:hypothetical protein Tco_0853673, partial [Tanacetum coccineum]
VVNTAASCTLFLLTVSAVLSLILLVGWFLLVVSNHAGVTMYLLPE